MKKTLKVLHVEDQEQDVALLTRHLTRAGYEPLSERVDTPEAMRDALASREWDVIFCDYTMPKFSALSALTVLRETGLDIPFIVISGTIGEAMAVEAMRAGANDYLMKDNLARLAPTIERELLEAENRRARRQAEEQLHKTETEYRRLLDTSYEGIWVVDADLRTTYVNRRLAEMLRAGDEELVGRSAAEFMVAADADGEGRWQRLRAGSKEQYDLRLRRTDGSDLWLIVCATPIQDENGEFIGALFMLTDITKRKHAEEELKKSEERYRDLVENADDVIYSHDLQGNFTSINKAGEQLTGYRREESLGINLAQIVAPEYVARAQQMILKKLAGEPVTTYDLEIIARDGRRIALEVDTRIMRQDGVAVGVQGIARDVTERKQLEAQLRQAQKMEAVGQLAGGIAHDFNNLLTVILGYCDLTLWRLPEGDPLRRNLEEIKSSSNRAAALTRQLLAFSRKQVLQPKILSLNEVVSDLEKMLRRLIGEDIAMKTVLEPELGSVEADPGQIEQIIMNLIVNARDAMPHGGKLTIETKNIYLNEEYVRHHIAVVPGPYVMIAVSDTGTGMDKKTQARIFEPFFTTKETGKGTGLGLSTIYGIVKQSGGNIWVYSEVGQGTTFKIYLPRVDEGGHEPGRSGQVEKVPCGGETILLAEDEEMVRKLACQVLETYGYQVLAATNGAEALLLSEREKERIDLLITDVIMPEMNGRELVNRLVQIHPRIKVLYMSGYTDNAIAHQGILAAGENFIQKPFAPDDLARKVREILGTAS